MRDAVQTPDPYLTEIASHLVVAGGKRLRPVVASWPRPRSPGTRRATTSCAAASRASSCTSARCTTTTSSTRPTRGAGSRRSTPSGATCRRSSPATSCCRGRRRSPPSLGTEVAGLLARTIGWLCQGEIEQLRHTYDTDAHRGAATSRRSHGKTAALFGTAARIGGIVAGLDRRDRRRRSADAATPFGMVFQIVDDILDITATDEQLGKPAGHDMVEGVYTLPVLRTLDARPRRRRGAAVAARQAARRRRARQGAGDRAGQRGRRERGRHGAPLRRRGRGRLRRPAAGRGHRRAARGAGHAARVSRRGSRSSAAAPRPRR